MASRDDPPRRADDTLRVVRGPRPNILHLSTSLFDHAIRQQGAAELDHSPGDHAAEGYTTHGAVLFSTCLAAAVDTTAKMA